jgi:hypothetical protein
VRVISAALCIYIRVCARVRVRVRVRVCVCVCVCGNSLQSRMASVRVSEELMLEYRKMEFII